MVPLNTFLDKAQALAETVREYKWGADGTDGECDCIGLIIGALRLAGFRWPGTHGTNWAARNAMSPPGLCCIDPSAADGGTSPDRGGIFRGEIVFKTREPGDRNYSLPDAYKNSPDKRDYYHVGIVMQVSPLVILHCTDTPGGIRRDSKIGSWRFGGRLKYIDYNEGSGNGMEETYWAVVTADNGYPVKLRKEPSRQAGVLARVPVGSRVLVVDNPAVGWDLVDWDGQSGYMMVDFLEPVDDTEQEGDTVEMPRDYVERAVKLLEETAAMLRESLGEGALG